MDVINLLEDQIKVIPRFPTIFPHFNAMIGGGNPRGIVEIYGPESNGKTMLLLQILGGYLKDGACCGLFDQEDYFQQDPVNLERIKRLMGIDSFRNYQAYATAGKNKGSVLDTSCFQVWRADCLEEMMELMADQAILWRKEKICAPDQPIVFGLDSLANTETQAEESRGYGEKEMASVPASLSRNLKKFSKIAYKHNVIWIVLNQEREKIGVFFGEKTLTPGGRAIKFAAFIRIRMTIIKSLADGAIVQFQTKKNKIYVPRRAMLMPFSFGDGFSPFQAAVQTLKAYGLLQETGKGYKLRKEGEREFSRSISKQPTFKIEQQVINYSVRQYQRNDCIVGKKKDD